MTTHLFHIDKEIEAQRIDKYLSDKLGLVTRSQLKALLIDLRVNGKQVKPSRHVQAGSTLEVVLGDPPEPEYAAEEMTLSILYEDENVVLINKPQGMVVHPGSGVFTGTLVQGLLYHVANLTTSFADEKIRPGIVHRLDKDTTGVIITAKNPAAFEFLSRQFRKRTTRKIYLALVKGHPPEKRGIIEGFMKRDPVHRKKFILSDSGGKQSLTEYQVLSSWEGAAFLLLSPKTGRTHQLRVHMKSIGCPIIGDPLYGKADLRFKQESLMLHAYKLEIVIPGETGKRKFFAPMPERFKKLLKDLT